MTDKTGYEQEKTYDIIFDYLSNKEYCDRWGYDNCIADELPKMVKELTNRGIFSYNLRDYANDNPANV